jgi:hypothetical protein
MNSNRSLRSNTNITGRTSPTFQTTKTDSLINRSSSPLNTRVSSQSPLNTRVSSQSPRNSRLSSLREQDDERNEFHSKKFNDDDGRFHKVAFERCADPPERVLITSREKFGQGKLTYFYLKKKAKIFYILALSYVGYDLLKTRIDELWSKNDREITFKIFQRILNEEKPIDERTLEEAFEILYNKDHKYDWNSVDFDRFRMDLVEVDFQIY